MTPSSGAADFYGATDSTAPSRPADVKIGIIGGPGSGKSTYIAVLQLAAAHQDTSASLSIRGAEEDFPGSAQYLDDQTALIMRRELPPITVTAVNYGYHVEGQLSASLHPNNDLFAGLEFQGLAKIFMGKRQPTPPIAESRLYTALLHLQDFPGETFRDARAEDPMWQHLATCNGIIFLFDLRLEQNEWPQNYTYLGKSLDYIARWVRHYNHTRSTRFTNKSLAVCIAKIDHHDILTTLIKDKFLAVNNDNKIEFVAGADSAFEKLAHPLLKSVIRDYFNVTMTKYFWLSNIGFHYDGFHGKNIDSLDNVVESSERKRIKGAVQPLGVLEPFVWLVSQQLHSKADSS